MVSRFPHAPSDSESDKPKAPLTRLTLRLPADLAAQLRALARIRGCASSMLMVDAVAREIANLPNHEKTAIGEVIEAWAGS